MTLPITHSAFNFFMMRKVLRCYSIGFPTTNPVGASFTTNPFIVPTNCKIVDKESVLLTVPVKFIPAISALRYAIFV